MTTPDSNETLPPPRVQKSIRLWNDPIVRPPLCASYSVLKKDDLDATVSDLLYWCDLAKGAGLAAPQIGVAARIFVARIAGNMKVFFDPQIVDVGKEAVRGREGCLSIPGAVCYVNRWASVDLAFTDEAGNSMLGQFKGNEARVIQHEVQHLDSVLMIDNCSPLVQQMTIKKAQRFLVNQAHKHVENAKLEKWKNEISANNIQLRASQHSKRLPSSGGEAAPLGEGTSEVVPVLP